MKTIRSFLAIDLCLQTARALGDFQRTLAERCREAGARVSWVPPQNLHVTIAFLGQVTEPMVSSLSSVLAPAAAAIPSFDMACAGLGAFPDPGHPRVIWAGVSSPGGELEFLHSRVVGILGETGFNLDGKPFRSHVTIGRVRALGDGGLDACLAGEAPDGFGETRVADLACYRSDLDPKGADYQLLWRTPLTGRATTPERQPKE
jgi:2'-5' RNA ligase